jgi:hypothetical protein
MVKFMARYIRKIIFLCLLILPGLIVFYFWPHKETNSNISLPPVVIKNNDSIETNKSDQTQEKSTARNTNEKLSSTSELPALPDSERAVFLNFTKQDLADYASYSEEVLFSLIKSGDVKAINYMADKKFKEGNLQEAGLLYIDQSIRGGVGSIYKLSSISSRLADESLRIGDKEAAEYHHTQKAAWMKVLVLRGIPEHLLSKEVINSDEVNIIANQHLTMLEAERIKIGLDNFNTGEMREGLGAVQVLFDLGEKYQLPEPYQDTKFGIYAR